MSRLELVNSIKQLSKYYFAMPYDIRIGGHGVSIYKKIMELKNNLKILDAFLGNTVIS